MEKNDEHFYVFKAPDDVDVHPAAPIKSTGMIVQSDFRTSFIPNLCMSSIKCLKGLKVRDIRREGGTPPGADQEETKVIHP